MENELVIPVEKQEYEIIPAIIAKDQAELDKRITKISKYKKLEK